MKPAPFEYHRPASVTEACQILSVHSDEGKVIAGGQSLVPMMNFRLARPEHLIDINGLAPLEGVRHEGDRLRVGALTRHVDLENSAVPGPTGTLLRAAASHVGHLPIRTRGTFGGSLAHSDPASEWCLVATLLDAEMLVRSSAGERSVAAEDFFVTVFTTAMEPSELLVEASLPVLGPEHRVGIVEFARRAGDFAIVASVVDIAVEDGIVTSARVALGGVSDRPVRSRAAEAALVGRPAVEATFREAGEAAADAVEPAGDLHGSREYRKDLVRALVPRSLLGASA